MYNCLHGHISTEADYCSECGAKIIGLKTGEFSPQIAISCPACSTPPEADSGNFCEICGYNFLTAARGGEAFPAPIVSRPIPPIQAIAKWQAIVSLDPSLATPDSPPVPTAVIISMDLIHPTNLIGRTSQARGIHPEIPLNLDDAVSSRHAIITIQPNGSLVLRDIGSSNGTMVNGKQIAVMVDVEIRSGDEITLGHWTKIKILRQ